MTANYDKWTTTAILSKPEEPPRRSWWVTESREAFMQEFRKELPRLRSVPGKEAYKAGGGMD